MPDVISNYHQVRVLLYPYQTGGGYAWVVHYVTTRKGVPDITQAHTGRVEGPADLAGLQAFTEAVAEASRVSL